MPEELDALALVPWGASTLAWLTGLGVLVLVLGLVRARRPAIAVAALFHLVGPPATVLLAYASLARHMAQSGAERVASSLFPQLGWAALAGAVLLTLVEGLLVAATPRPRP